MCHLVLCHGDHDSATGFVGALLVSVPVVIAQGVWAVAKVAGPAAVIVTVHTARYLAADVRALTHLVRIAAPHVAEWSRTRATVPPPPAVNRGLAITATPHVPQLTWSAISEELSR